MADCSSRTPWTGVVVLALGISLAARGHTTEASGPFKVTLSGPKESTVDRPITFHAKVVNTSGQRTEKRSLVVASSTLFDPEITALGDIHLDVEPLAPNESRSFSFTLTPRRECEFQVELTLALFGVASTKVQVRYDAKAPVQSFLPAPPKAATVNLRLPRDLADVPELSFSPTFCNQMKEGEPLEYVACLLDKIHYLNRKKTDGYMQAMVEHRADLAGLPFVLGEACRLKGDERMDFARAVFALRSTRTGRRSDDPAIPFFKELQEQTKSMKYTSKDSLSIRVRAIMQVAPMESPEIKHALVTHLQVRKHAETSRALARLALYSEEEKTRKAAVEALTQRPVKEYEDLLWPALGYPWPAVAERAAIAIAHLKLTDGVPRLIQVLERPDPRLPQLVEVKGKKVNMVRELVRVNHHRNCLLCHAPAERTAPVAKVDPSTLTTAQILLPDSPFPVEYYSNPPRPGLLVRFDVTYLRQDFSLMQEVENASPWPKLQRFDFLVRTRQVSEQDARSLRELVAADASSGVSPYQYAAVAALRRLTGRDAEPTAEAWTKLLPVKKNP